MFEQRYECVKDDNGTWGVIDTFTGRICEIGDREVSRLSESDAKEIRDIMNGPRSMLTIH